MFDVDLRNFLLTALPSGVEIIRAQVNRTPEPKLDNFIVMTPLFRNRLETNIDRTIDIIATASINGATMTVTAVSGGVLRLGSVLMGANLAPRTTVLEFLSGNGGAGTYVVDPPQAITAQQMYAGELDVMQNTDIVVQLDVHGPSSADIAQIVATLWRDDYAIDLFSRAGSDMTPLYASDPRQSPFVNDQEQWEYRWTVDLHMQANVTVIVPQQFADQLRITPRAVEAAFPA